MYIALETEDGTLVSLPIGSFGYHRLQVGIHKYTNEPDYRASLFYAYMDTPIGVTKESYESFNQRLLEML